MSFSIQHDGEHWRVLRDGVVMDTERHDTYEEAQSSHKRLSIETYPCPTCGLSVPKLVKPLHNPAIRNVRTVDWENEA